MAVGAFTCYDLVTGGAVLAAAEARGVGVILLVSAGAARGSAGRGLLQGLRALAEDCASPCCLQLDHCDDLEVMELALEAGAGAIMADGSRLADERNAELVARGVALASAYGAAVEAELGHISGDEEVSGAGGLAGSLTEPDAAERFVAQTGAHCLAVSIGNVHGPYRGPPVLDLPRLREIRARVAAPLALHGASGIEEALVRQTVAHGISKVNVNQELRVRWFTSVHSLTAELAAGARLLVLQRRLSEDVGDVVNAKLAALEPAADPAEVRGDQHSRRGEEQHGAGR